MAEKIYQLFLKRGRVNKNILVVFSIASIFIFGILIKFIFLNYKHLVPKLSYFSVPFIFSFFGVVFLTPLMILISRKMNIMDYPSARKNQKEGVPLLGGVGIFVTFLCILYFFRPWTLELKGIIIGASLLFVVGTIDDIKPLSSLIRLLAQIVASLIVMSSGLMVSFVPNSEIGMVLGGLITLVWLIGITNALNFSDGADGLAAGIAVIASTFFFLITLHHQQYNVALLCIVLGGSGLGFLVYNFRPAKIYLGDGGSNFLGFLIASVALYGGWSDRGSITALGIPILILGVLIYDMCYITVSRIRNGLIHNVKEWLNFTGRDHFHHRLMHLGFKVEYAVAFIYGVCIILGLSALVLEDAESIFPVVVMLIQGALIFLNITLLMLVGRRLYLPKKAAKDVLPDCKQLDDSSVEFVSGDTLKELLNEENTSTS
jgi:UDP-GlcNAc:undecaprenyl-phosphate GlcNAc-1-phosphate transferase